MNRLLSFTLLFLHKLATPARRRFLELEQTLNALPPEWLTIGEPIKAEAFFDDLQQPNPGLNLFSGEVHNSWHKTNIPQSSLYWSPSCVRDLFAVRRRDLRIDH